MSDNDQKNLPARQQQRREFTRVQDVQPLFDTAKFEQMQRAATALMNSSLLPEAVRGASAQECYSNLLLIFEQADRWNIPATALAQCVSVVHGKLMYEGKAVTAGLEGTLGIKLYPHYVGERGTDSYRVYVSDRSFDELTDEQLAALEPDKYPRGFRMIDGTVGDWKTFQKNGRDVNPAWTGARTRNQLFYRGSREWARLHEPGAILGVYGDDEISAFEAQVVNVTTVSSGDAPSISAGFTRPAETSEVHDAEITEAARGDAGGDQAASEDAGKAADPPGPSEDAKPAQDAPQARRGRNGGKDPEVAAEPAAGGEATDPESGGEGEGDAASQAMTEEDLARQAPGDLLGAPVDEEDDESGDADPDDEDDDLESGDDDDDDFPGDAKPKNAFDIFAESIREQEDVPSIKRLLSALATSPDWKAGTPEQYRAARISAGLRVEELKKAGLEFDETTDLTMFRCWAEWQTDVEVVRDAWDLLVQTDNWKAVAPDKQDLFSGAIGLIMQRLKA